MPDKYITVIEDADNVATALRDIAAGETVEISVGSESRTIEVLEDVQFGHKLAIELIPAGETVTKYGKSIGNATEDIESGEWVHVHNVESNYGRGDIAEDSEVEAISE
jgi:altronate dehydratase small subunit